MLLDIELSWQGMERREDSRAYKPFMVKSLQVFLLLRTFCKLNIGVAVSDKGRKSVSESLSRFYVVI
jgi:hypothetical protein